MLRLSLLALLSLALGIAAGCDDGASTCDADELRARLAAATSGEIVSVDGACSLTGPFEVPAGVTLTGPEATIVAPTDGRAVVLLPSADPDTPTTVRDLSIESLSGCAAVVAMGEGAIAIRDVSAHADSGVGIAVEGATTATIAGVSVTGSLTAESADSTMAPLPPFACGSGAIATHGIVLVEVASAVISDSSAAGFGRFGLLAIGSDLEATDVQAAHNLGAGVEIWGGSAQLTAVTVDETRDGLSAIETYGVVYGGAAVVDTMGLAVVGSDGYGVFADGASATHDGLVATDNAFAGVWAQNTDGFSISGESTMIADNAFAGVAILDSMSVSVADATIRDTTEGIAVSGLGTVMGADGIHLIASEVDLSSLSLIDNGRVGAVLDLDGATTDRLSLTDVTVDASGMALGVVAQNGTPVTGWDDGVMRLGDTAANDSAFAGALEIAGRVGPPCLPPLDGLDTGGIAALVGP
jgi:hypothetical protein